ncbi:MAG: phage baseplate assembly protein V [Sphingorhabdus sp.]
MIPTASQTGTYANSAQWFTGVHIGRVVAVNDPQNMGRVQVIIPAIDIGGEAPIWARVVTPFAGNEYGAFFIPDVDSEVLIAFTAGDTAHPVVLGNMWNGAHTLPEETPGDGVNLWSITGKAGTRIAIVEDSAGSEEVEISTPGNRKVTVTDAGGGKIKLKSGGNTITMSGSGIKVKSGSEITVEGSTVSVTAGMVSVDAALSEFSGIVRCDTLITNSVVSTSYTPGAGNVW